MSKKNKVILTAGFILAFVALIFATKFFKNKASNDEIISRINIAYASDKAYVFPTLVSMVSVMENSKKSTECDFTILLSGEITDSDKEKFKSVEKKYSNCKVNLVDMSGQFDGSEVRFWSKAMYYRLSLPEILSNEKRCIYLDGDTIARKDLSEMFNLDMNDYYVAGIRDSNEIINSKSEHYKVLGVPNLNSYVCSGVLIMNLEKIRNDNITAVFGELVKQNDANKMFKFPDQDVINKACYGHIFTMPFKYGALAHTDLTVPYSKSEYAQWASNKKDWEEGRKDPTVVHFTGTKPWVEKYSDLCKEWWNYAEKTGFGNEIKNAYPNVK